MRAAIAVLVLAAWQLPAVAVAAAPARDEAYRASLDAGMRHFYARGFAQARDEFAAAHGERPDDALTDAFYAAAAVRAGRRADALAADLEERAALAPTDAAAQALAGFVELLPSRNGVDLTMRARLAFQRAAALDPQSPAPHVGLGILAFDGNRVADAKRELLEALRLAPQDPLAREYLAQLDLQYLQEPLRAIAVLIDVPNSVPGYADAYYHLGEAALAAGQKVLAARFLERCLALDPHAVGEGGRYGPALLARAIQGEGRVEDAQRVRREGGGDE